MTPTNTEALAIADALEKRLDCSSLVLTADVERAAAELRRLSAVEAERDALRADALRYRWLRIALADKTDKGRSHWFCCIGSSDEFDAAIDAAMKGAQ